MDEKKELPEEESGKPVSQWQRTKESWYDKIPLTVRQLDVIIWGGTAALILVFILIGLDAAGVF